MNQIKKMILFKIPMSICNFRCHYCYLAQRDVCYEGKQIEWIHTPDEYKIAFSRERIGGLAYFNVCADGETLLVKDIDKYVKVLCEEGHYVELVTNCTISSVLDKILLWDKELLKHIEFKCSFHYLELKKKNLLNLFAENVNKIWNSGASANVEITPSDELIPYIDEIKDFSMREFGALPHFTIARNDRTKKIEYLTKLDMAKYDKIWGQFSSEFWEYKKTIFGKKQKGFCYAGKWSMYCDIVTGDYTQCYFGKKLGNVFENLDDPFVEEPIGKCEIAHCYNGHMFLTLGLIPEICVANYGDIRDRKKVNGDHWLQPEFKSFINSKLYDNNELLTKKEKRKILKKKKINKILRTPKKVLKKVFK